MKQLGNLAIIAAQREDMLFQLLNGEVTIFFGSGPDRTSLSALWNDDEQIDKIIYELNFGKWEETKCQMKTVSESVA